MSKGQLFPQPNPGSAVNGPNASTDGDIVQFDGTSGKAIKDGGLSVDVDATMAANSDLHLASQKATKAYADLKAPQTRTISTTAPLAGGGDLSANRTFSVGVATNSALGVVKPDGTSIVIDGSGMISATAGAGGTAVYEPWVKPVSPSTFDDEFEASSLNAAWTVQNPSSLVTPVFQPLWHRSQIYLPMPASASAKYLIRKPFAQTGDYSVTIRIFCDNLTPNFQTLGMGLSDTLFATNQDSPTVANGFNTGNTIEAYYSQSNVQVLKLVNGVQTTSLGNVNPGNPVQCFYLHFQRKSGSYGWFWSIGGHKWNQVTLGALPAFNPAYVFLFAAPYSGATAFNCGIDFIRCNWLFL